MIAKADTAREVAWYDYQDETGNVLYQVVRYEPKGFRQRVPIGNGKYCWSLQGIRRVLYHLPVLTKLKLGSRVYVVEGEKDADNLMALGVPATTSPGGAGSWRSEYSQYLDGFEVVVCPDTNLAGQEYGRQVLASTRSVATRTGYIELPDGMNDVSDYLALGGTVQSLERLIKWID